MDENKSVNMWLTLATEKIKFSADRRAVHAELREHIEDKILDIRRIYPDMSEEAATQRALGQMGDAVEVGRELAKIHRPWLGYFWRLSQVLLTLVCLYFGLQIWGGDDLWPGYGPTSLYSTGEGIERYMEKHYPDYYDARPIKLPLPDPVTAGEYTISIIDAELWGSKTEQPDWKYEREVYLTFEVEYDRFWESPLLFIHNIYAEDDLGNRVYSNIEFDEWEGIPSDPFYTKFGRRTYESVRRSRYEILIPVPDWQAKKLYIKYDRQGVDFSFALDLTGGAL